MKKEILHLAAACLLFVFSCASLFSDEREGQSFMPAPAERGDVWISAGTETALYSANGLSYGAGLSLAYGKRVSIGIKGAFFMDGENELDVLEINLFLHWFMLDRTLDSGPFLQFTAGPAFFFEREKGLSLPARMGMVTAGLGFGWRFLLANRFFIEPAIRAGYPFAAGISLSGGVRF